MKMLTHLASSNNRKNRTRSILIILTVLLTTMLLMAIATFGYGTVRTQKENAGNLYGTYYGSYRNVTESQIQDMEMRGEFSEVGRAAVAGTVRHEKSVNLMWADETTRRLTNLDLQLGQGAFPEEEDEIAAQPGFFKSLGYDKAGLGDRIILQYRTSLREPYREGSFVISGLLRESEGASQGYTAYVSQKFLDARIPEEERGFLAYFRLDDSLKLNYDGAEEEMKELAAECGIDEKYVSKNSYYLMLKLDPDMETIAACLILSALVILFSVAVIYNIFQVGIAQKVQEYGRIKAIGTTGKQMKKIVFREGMLLAVIGVPLGLLAGYFAGKGLVHYLMESANSVDTNTQLQEVSMFSPPLLALAALLSFLTVWLALKKPMHIVASISPVEAMKYQEGTKKGAGLRKGRKNMDTRGLTLATLRANRRRTAATITTMGLSCVLFVILANLVGNMDDEYNARKDVPYGQFAVDLDYSTQDTAYPENNLDQILKQNPLGNETVEKIRALNGVTEVRTRKVLAGFFNGQQDSVAVLDQEEFERRMEGSGAMGTLDYGKASEENGIFYGWSHFLEETGTQIGDPLSVILQDGNSTAELQGSLQGAFGNLEASWGITEETCQKLGLGEGSNGTIFVDCREKDCPMVEGQLEALFEGVENVEILSYQAALDTAQMSSRMIKQMIYGFLVVIGLIGFMNMANTMIISIITRKRELGILQAIGMTNRQLNRMLQAEGLFFTIGTILVSLAVGIPGGYALFLYGKKSGWTGLYSYHFPAAEVLLMIAAIGLLQLTLSFLLSRNVKKESLVERIRHQE